ncbi:hypothetical protein [Peribacillus butanolivorans]
MLHYVLVKLFWDDIKLPYFLNSNNNNNDPNDLTDEEVIIAEPLYKDIKKYLKETVKDIRDIISDNSKVYEL